MSELSRLVRRLCGRTLTMNRTLDALTIAVHALFPTYVAALLWSALLIRDGVRAALPAREAT
jgi:hypothetical protein